MVDTQASVTRSMAVITPTSTASTSSSPPLHEDDHFRFKTESDEVMTEDDDTFYDPSTPSLASPYGFYPHHHQTATILADIETQPPHNTLLRTIEDDQVDDAKELFASYQPSRPEDLDDSQIRPNTWDYYYPPSSSATGTSSDSTAATTSVVSTAACQQQQQQQQPTRFRQQAKTIPPVLRFPPASVTSMQPTTISVTVPAASTTNSNSRNSQARHGVKRPLERTQVDNSTNKSPVSIANSMIAMRNKPEMVDNKSVGSSSKSGVANVTPTNGSGPTTVNADRKAKKEGENGSAVSSSSTPITPTTKKTKVSRERQLKINAASRRCRKKQKLELQFLRTHVVELQSALKEQVTHFRGSLAHQQRAARLSHFLDESIRKVEEMSSGARPSAAASTLTATTSSSTVTTNPFHSDAEFSRAKSSSDDRSGEDTDGFIHQVNTIETDDASSIHAIDPLTGYSLTEARKKTLLNIASFIRVNISLESRSFTPEVISCLPIEMDGWQLRLAITEKNYTIHNCKFFPCNLNDMYDFCWETNVAQKISIKHGKKHYVVVTPLDTDVAHVYSKTIGKWSLSVHGVPNVSYNSLVCRTYDPDQRRAIICQQSVLEERDFEDANTIPWLFKRWVVFQPRVVDGVEGTFVEAYRTASYATGRLIYKENNTYDSFCEHLIRRYAESNSLLERMMARDKRFQHVAPVDIIGGTDSELELEETTSDRMVKDLLLF